MGSSSRAKECAVLLTVVLLIGSRIHVEGSSEEEDNQPTFLFGEGDTLSIRTPFLLDDNADLSGWKALGSATLSREQDRDRVVLTAAEVNMDGVVVSTQELASSNFDAYVDVEVGKHQASEDHGDGIIIWLLNKDITTTGSILGAPADVDGTGIVIKPPYSRIPASKPHVFIIQPDGSIPDLQTRRPLTSIQVGRDCTLRKPEGFKRIYFSLRDGTLKVWLREFPSTNMAMNLCAIVHNVPFRARRLAVSASTSGEAYAAQILYQFQIRAEGGSYYQSLNTMNHHSRQQRTHSKFHHQNKDDHATALDAKFFDLQSHFMLSLDRPHASEDFLRQVGDVLNSIFEFMERKEGMVDSLHSVFVKMQESPMHDEVRKIEQKSEELISGIEYVHAKTSKLKRSTTLLSNAMKEQIKGLQDAANKGGSMRMIFWTFMVTSQITFGVLLVYAGGFR